MWFIFALIALVGWGCADLFYKTGTDSGDRYSHLKIAVWVGLVMGVCSAVILLSGATSLTAGGLARGIVGYSPASLPYIISMVIGYAGLRYLEVSIISPVQNASGGLATVAMLVYFIAVGKIASVRDEFSVLDLAGTLLVVVGVIALAVVEQRKDREERTAGEKKYRTGALALIFPISYCIFDTLGTAADGIILDEETGLGLGELEVLVLYGLTFFAAGVAAWLFLLIKNRRIYNPFSPRELKTKGTAAVFEELGQVFYIYAMAANPVAAAPMIASYCIVSIILSRIFLKEKLFVSQYICVITVIAGILLLGISEGLYG